MLVADSVTPLGPSVQTTIIAKTGSHEIRTSTTDITVSECIKCYDCNILDSRSPKDCPGNLIDYPTANACRVLALSDGTMIQQIVSPESLCSESNFKTLKIRVAKQFHDGEADAMCCFTDGCNSSPRVARQSLETKPNPNLSTPPEGQFNQAPPVIQKSVSGGNLAKLQQEDATGGSLRAEAAADSININSRFRLMLSVLVIFTLFII
ncbi:uncharacterized protein LOC111696802 isoform X2 [Eurytemora carolleeae]|uniref:uncharacterized protein LOC111696802 isoform X2 n=1 Tax=Eurytemora carolleeae TaxID=1294199 RepID=UPI000C76A5FA|nr:uncharacterized protein LOC111696802 isoform X2 [Eurytemora carolleeae]|eukprot:XP_023322311.1 uncharacterized protein LOC111696802 isoform X2 [Eurytemora affinis]